MVDYNEVEVSLKAGWLITMRWREVTLKAGWLITMIGESLTQGWVVAYNEVQVSRLGGCLQ